MGRPRASCAWAPRGKLGGAHEFDDCDVSVGQSTTTLSAELPDQGALQGLLQRITSLGLELVTVSQTAR